MNWTVETLNQDVDRELEAMPKSLKARFIRIAELIELQGNAKLFVAPQALPASQDQGATLKAYRGYGEKAQRRGWLAGNAPKGRTCRDHLRRCCA